MAQFRTESVAHFRAECLAQFVPVQVAQFRAEWVAGLLRNPQAPSSLPGLRVMTAMLSLATSATPRYRKVVVYQLVFQPRRRSLELVLCQG